MYKNITNTNIYNANDNKTELFTCSAAKKSSPVDLAAMFTCSAAKKSSPVDLAAMFTCSAAKKSSPVDLAFVLSEPEVTQHYHY